MTSYVALLRGGEPVGGPCCAMADLKALAEKLRFKSVRTFIASGNLLFASAKREAAVKPALEAAAEGAYGRGRLG